MLVNGGGVVTNTGAWTIGSGTLSYGNSVTVTNASVVTAGIGVYLGAGGGASNSLNVLAGGVVDLGQSQVYIGGGSANNNTYASNNTLTINSGIITNVRTINVGYFGAALIH